MSLFLGRRTRAYVVLVAASDSCFLSFPYYAQVVDVDSLLLQGTVQA